MTYDFITNSLAAEVASLGYHPPQVVGDVNTCANKSPESGVKERGGAIFTGFYPNWSELSDGEKQSIFEKRGRLNIKGRGKRKYFDKNKQIRDDSMKFKR